MAEALATWSTRPGPLHLRLSEALEDAISQGILLPGTRLPAERALANVLSLSRTTIVSAYSNLRDRGRLESKTGSGTWVSRGHASGARSQAHSNVVTRGSLLNLLQVNDPAPIDLAMATTEPLPMWWNAPWPVRKKILGTCLDNAITCPLSAIASKRRGGVLYKEWDADQS